MPASEAQVATSTPARYVTRLCKHFAHRTAATFSEGEGRVEFPMGVATLTAEPGRLVLRAEAADEAALREVEGVIERHLVRFATEETLEVAWA